jgi:hypothetical protein
MLCTNAHEVESSTIFQEITHETFSEGSEVLTRRLIIRVEFFWM